VCVCVCVCVCVAFFEFGLEEREHDVCGFDLSVSGRGDVAGSCKHGNEHSDFR